MATTPADGSVWQARTDGPGPEHARWHQCVRIAGADARLDTGSAQADDADDVPGTDGTDIALVGFASDEGVRRNSGRPGAAQGPDALRRALAPLPAHSAPRLVDLGTVAPNDDGDDGRDGPDEAGAPTDALAAAQRDLGDVVSAALDAHRLVVVLGGGHETAYGSYLGWSSTARCAGARVGVLNLDAHFDLREADRPTSGTPFLQMARDEAAAGRALRYAVIGISEASNTRALFDTARALGVPHVLDRDAQPRHLDRLTAVVDEWLADVDVVHLSIDLDVLPAAQAPGVSAPAAYGVPVETVVEVCRRVALSGRLALVDIVELCPPLDIDGRTARTATRLVHDIVGCLPPR